MFKRILTKLLLRFGNEFESCYLRLIFKAWYKIDVGLYSYGCFDPTRIPRDTQVGRYCSFAKTCCFFARDHGVSYLALHPFLYNSRLGLVEKDTIENQKFVVEDDVWIGHNVTVTSKAERIGRGAVLAANSVVTSSVPRYSIVAGNPARIIRSRFNEEVIRDIEASKWWTLDKEELKKLIETNPSFAFNPGGSFEERN